MGFIPDVERIVGLLSKNRQTLFFSATMPPEIRRLADAFLKEPVEISVAPPASPAELVEQALVVVASEDKRDALRRLIASEDVKNALIFCNRKRDVDILQKSLSRHGLDAAALHGDMSQPKRTETLERFKNGEIRLLVCSDVAARGLDIQGLSHVFNFDVPYHAEDYVHRIGRTGRAGRQGCSFTLAAPEDGKNIAAIQQLIGKEIPTVAIADLPLAELDFSEGADRRRSRSRGTTARSSARSARPEKRLADERPAGERPARQRPAGERPRRDPPAEPRRTAAKPVKEPNVAVFPGPAARSAPRRPQSEPRREQPEPEHRVVGFGDDLPAFLRRGPRVAAGA
jgi:superfamily II DNA/RNA helicase